jgi:hypothetical protein
MLVIIKDSYAEISKAEADMVARTVRNKPHATLGLAWAARRWECIGS